MKKSDLRKRCIQGIIATVIVIFLATDLGSGYMEKFLHWGGTLMSWPFDWHPHEFTRVITNGLQFFLGVIILLSPINTYYLERNILICNAILNTEENYGSQRLTELLNLIKSSNTADFKKYKNKLQDALADFLYASFSPGQKKEYFPGLFADYFDQIERTIYPPSGRTLKDDRKRILEDALLSFKEKMGNEALARVLLTFLKAKGFPKNQFKSFLIMISAELNSRIREILVGLPENERETRQAEYDTFIFNK